jgi:hypothetical protein
MADDDPRQYFRRFARRGYLRQHENQRRADAKAQGARRIDVTLQDDALEHYDTVRRYLQGLNRFAAKTTRLSATEVIKLALDRAAAAILEDDAKAAKSGQRRMLTDDQPE